MTSSFEPKGAWEGLGGPIRMAPTSFDDIDPTLDACCRREEETNRKGSAMMRTIRKFDVVAERERRRRHLVTLQDADAGCRCCYDPNSDGRGEYRALTELRLARNEIEREKQNNDDDDNQRQQQQLRKDNAREEEEKKRNDRNDNDDSDDEFDYLLDEDLPSNNEAVKAFEESRRAELEETFFLQELAQQHGYGVHRAMHPLRVLKAAGLVPGAFQPPPAVVLHLVDPDSILSASLDLYLETLAASSTEARGTKFLRSGGRSTLLMESELAQTVFPSSLSTNMDADLPALIAIREGVVVNVCPGLSGLCDRNNKNNDNQIAPDAVHTWLERSGVLLNQIPPLDLICRIRPEEMALLDYTNKTAIPSSDAEIFDCGVPNCAKTYFHEHVGIANERQSGLVIKENEVIGGTTQENPVESGKEDI